MAAGICCGGPHHNTGWQSTQDELLVLPSPEWPISAAVKHQYRLDPSPVPMFWMYEGVAT